MTTPAVLMAMSTWPKCATAWSNNLTSFSTTETVSYTHLTLPTNREV